MKLLGELLPKANYPYSFASKLGGFLMEYAYSIQDENPKKCVQIQELVMASIKLRTSSYRYYGTIAEYVSKIGQSKH